MLRKKEVKLSLLSLSVLLSVSLFAAPEARAASEDECAIWLCLPNGFGEGCGAAKSAFKSRIKHHKSPLPAWHECAIDDGSGNDEAPYSYTERFETWYNNGDQVYSKNGKNCPSSGQIITSYSCPNGYTGRKQVITAICANTVKYTSTFFGSGEVIISDPVEHSGTDLDKVLNGSFTPKTISTCTRKPSSNSKH